jgi:hypothetical protein
VPPHRGGDALARRPAEAHPGVEATAAGDERPWERPGAVRRDCHAHRADLLLALASASLLLGALSLCLGFLAPAAFACGAAACGLAYHDLGRMRAGLMDPAGLAATRRARARALAGAALGLYGAFLWAWFLALLCCTTRP